MSNSVFMCYNRVDGILTFEVRGEGGGVPTKVGRVYGKEPGYHLE
jgi:hypothetical protein